MTSELNFFQNTAKSLCAKAFGKTNTIKMPANHNLFFAVSFFLFSLFHFFLRKAMGLHDFPIAGIIELNCEKSYEPD